MTLLELLNATADYFLKKGVVQPRLNAEQITAATLGVKRLDLYLQFQRVMTQQELDALRPLVKRRGEREPLQHIVGTAHFFGFDFRCDKRALIPRPETEVLVQTLLNHCAPSEGVLWDVGTGSGIIAISFLKHKPGWKAVASDISLEALSLAKENAALHAVDGRMLFVQAHLLDSVKGMVDAVAANLPYLPSGWIAGLQPEVQHDPRLALDGGHDGLRLILPLVKALPSILKPDGACALEIAPEQNMAVEQVFWDAGLVDVGTIQDLAGIYRIAVGRKKTAPVQPIRPSSA